MPVFRPLRLVPPPQPVGSVATVAPRKSSTSHNEPRPPLVVVGEMYTIMHEGTAKMLGHLATAGFLLWLAGVLLVFTPPAVSK